MSDIREENMFGWIGLKEQEDCYVSASGLYEAFWVLKPEVRVSIIEGWIRTLETFLDPKIQEKIDGSDEATIYISVDDMSVEDKPMCNVIPFPKRS